eukprot:4333902-Ditylum_brightwellii.AAC.1
MPISSRVHGNMAGKKKSKAGSTAKAGKQLQSKLRGLSGGKLQKITEEPEEQTKAGTPKPITARQKMNNFVDA